MMNLYRSVISCRVVSDLGWLIAVFALMLCGEVNAQLENAPVPISEIKIQKAFERTRLTKDNFSSFIASCIPTYPESAKDKFLADWRLPLIKSTMVLAHAQHTSFAQISGEWAVCVRESENKFPILPSEAFKNTANPTGISETQADEFYAKIAMMLAEKGFAEVAYILKQGNAYQVTYRVDRVDRGQLMFLETFRRKDHFQPPVGGLSFELPDGVRFSITRSDGRLGKPFFDAK
jgi:hypothetical protein